MFTLNIHRTVAQRESLNPRMKPQNEIKIVTITNRNTNSIHNNNQLLLKSASHRIHFLPKKKCRRSYLLFQPNRHRPEKNKSTQEASISTKKGAKNHLGDINRDWKLTKHSANPRIKDRKRTQTKVVNRKIHTTAKLQQSDPARGVDGGEREAGARKSGEPKRR